MAKEIGNIVFSFEGKSLNEFPTRCNIKYTLVNQGVIAHKGRYVIESGWDTTLQKFVDSAYLKIKQLEGMS